MLENIDPSLWFIKRELEYPPNHFRLSQTQLTLESKQWVLAKLKGRYSITKSFDGELDLMNAEFISFEDPKEAMIYELKWS